MVNALYGPVTPSEPINDARVPFWRNPDNWPEDAPGYIFLARAVEKAGRKRFSDSWPESAATTRLISPLKGALSIYTSSADLRRAAYLLQEHDEDYRKLNMPGILGPVDGLAIPTREEWRRALSLSEIESDASWEAHRPFLTITFALSAACKSGALLTATRGYRGGIMTDREPHFWNMERPWLRLDTCRITADDPFSQLPVTGSGEWIFVELRSFEKYVETSAAPAEEAAGTSAVEQKNVIEKVKRTGRPPKFNWLAFAGEVAKRACLSL